MRSPPSKTSGARSWKLACNTSAEILQSAARLHRSEAPSKKPAMAAIAHKPRLHRFQRRAPRGGALQSRTAELCCRAIARDKSSRSDLSDTPNVARHAGSKRSKARTVHILRASALARLARLGCVCLARLARLGLNFPPIPGHPRKRDNGRGVFDVTTKEEAPSEAKVFR